MIILKTKQFLSYFIVLFILNKSSSIHRIILPLVSAFDIRSPQSFCCCVIIERAIKRRSIEQRSIERRRENIDSYVFVLAILAII